MMAHNPEAQALKQRCKAFALRVIKVVDALPRTTSGRAIGAQLVRNGTSVGANYRAACRGRSRREFVAKLGIVEEEADESVWWLELVRDAGMVKPDRIESLLNEAEQLTAIMAASRITASASRRDNRADPSNIRQSPIQNRQFL